MCLNHNASMTTQVTIDLYVQAVDLAKEKEGIGNQEKLILNRFKILLRSGAVNDADSEMAQIGKVRKKTLHSIRELAESIFEDWVRKLNVVEAERDRMLREGKRRADFAEGILINEFRSKGIIVDN